jgi:hypothetical protein
VYRLYTVILDRPPLFLMVNISGGADASRESLDMFGDLTIRYRGTQLRQPWISSFVSRYKVSGVILFQRAHFTSAWSGLQCGAPPPDRPIAYLDGMKRGRIQWVRDWYAGVDRKVAKVMTLFYELVETKPCGL